MYGRLTVLFIGHGAWCSVEYVIQKGGSFKTVSGLMLVLIEIMVESQESSLFISTPRPEAGYIAMI